MTGGMIYFPVEGQVRPTSVVEEASAIFASTIRMVEIEVFSYCNRRCWFCPNATHDRISSNIHMRPELYTDLLGQLRSIDYKGLISFSRYNEPFADRVILDRIREAHETLPGARIHTNTNGDYLDFDYIEEIYDAGMRSLNIQFYLKNNDRYDHEAVRARALQTMARLKLPHTLVRDEPGVWLEYTFEYKDMTIRGYGRNFETDGTSRGGQVDIRRDYVRTSPCMMPYWAVYIDYNGKMVPCCNFRSDIPDHFDYIVGDLNEQPNLFLNYTNRRATEFRRSLANTRVKDGLCRDCYFVLETPTEDQVTGMAELLAATV
ncbi:hypothetical protein IP78_09680 [Brevundimonas sp. AAP58]|uniref:radical SAM/SPASM domain-containing protein n=1 Tax=Brevundimonas sp. AAP58 TaxID=1523422 RepID=UPI0006B8E1BB|nr:radical SAM/SPASM domain-containing protein [Brevundimonas sp. AAP58]KPF79144.1 hypothetical protein IP78_09680 [Brevundimonas sp. AAP58]